MGKLNRLVFHWSGGSYLSSGEDLEHYHFLVNREGKVISGKYTPEDNVSCFDGRYAKHTGGGNTGSIGVAFLGMYGFKNFKKQGKYPLTRRQCESGFNFAAKLCNKYKIDVDNLITHYEFGLQHPESESKGKIDIIHLHPYPGIKTNEVGEFIRGKVKWYLGRL